MLRDEYQGQRRIRVTAYEVPSFIFGQKVGAFLMQHGDLIEMIPVKMGQWKYYVMINHKSFNAVPNWILLNGRKSPNHFRTEICLLAMQREWASLRSLTPKRKKEYRAHKIIVLCPRMRLTKRLTTKVRRMVRLSTSASKTVDKEDDWQVVAKKNKDISGPISSKPHP